MTGSRDQFPADFASAGGAAERVRLETSRRNPSGLRVSGSWTFGSYAGSCRRSYRCRSMPSTSVASCRANEHLGILAPDGVAVQGRNEDERPLALAHRVTAADHGVHSGLPREAGRRRPEAQRLIEDPPDVAEFGHLLIRRIRVVAPHLVHFGLCAVEDVRIPCQVVQGEGQRARGRLVAGDEEGDDLVPDVDLVQSLRRFAFRFSSGPMSGGCMTVRRLWFRGPGRAALLMGAGSHRSPVPSGSATRFPSAREGWIATAEALGVR